MEPPTKAALEELEAKLKESAFLKPILFISNIFRFEQAFKEHKEKRFVDSTVRSIRDAAAKDLTIPENHEGLVTVVSRVRGFVALHVPDLAFYYSIGLDLDSWGRAYLGLSNGLDWYVLSLNFSLYLHKGIRIGNVIDDYTGKDYADEEDAEEDGR
jgi:hypothetical protein